MKKYEKPILIYEKMVSNDSMSASGYDGQFNIDHYDNGVNAGELSPNSIGRYSVFWE